MADILMAAESSGMTLKPDYKEDNTEMSSSSTENGKSEESANNRSVDNSILVDIADTPCVSMGVFEGERFKAKRMVKELATLWNTKDLEHSLDEGSSVGNNDQRNPYSKKKHMSKGIRDHRKGRRDKRDVW
uniref:Uncharacterized protein n=1 Tax=Eucampia antarctica TaxID=49252 RepID=A0A7S2WH60_9STRA|mmetsp:Transcript_30197/g.29074  ORF Transcript_30197/g.29074 Transcript_30197/m.29074 type:complete len:131 (-) Transcript_30197:286-678(-)